MQYLVVLQKPNEEEKMVLLKTDDKVEATMAMARWRRLYGRENVKIEDYKGEFKN